MIGNIVYLYILDLENNLAIKQELLESRFCRIVELNQVKGGTNDEKYIKYKLQSLDKEHTYEINNYLSPYVFCDLTTLENTIEKLTDILLEDRKEEMLNTLNKIKLELKEA